MIPWLEEALYSYWGLLGALIVLMATFHILVSLLADGTYTNTTYNPNGHTWRSIQSHKSIPYNNLCWVCCKLMLPTVGVFCECCGLSACKRCLRRIKKRGVCKPFTLPPKTVLQHHWVKVGSSRDDCVDSTDELQDYFCCWCQRVRNISTEPDNTKTCDFGELRKIIIPPTCVNCFMGNISITPLADADWEPIIVLANRKSGSNLGDEILSLFRGLLNPVQVVDLARTPPERVVEWLPPRCRLLVCGGDGTVAWVLNALADTKIQAPVAILPLGTGNDLSRVLGWGATSAADVDARALLRAVAAATVRHLDRWKVTIKARRGRLARRRERVLHAYNYASVGVDAQVALDFHCARSQFLARVASRTVNQIAYACFGATRALDDAGCFGLEQRLSVRVDGAARPLCLPPVQALVLLNIPSWGAGVDLWRTGGLPDDAGEQKIDDGKIEVVGISSSFHIARLQCGLASPYRFAQTTKVEMELTGACAMQVDGEPWMQRAATITLQHAGTSLVLSK